MYDFKVCKVVLLKNSKNYCGSFTAPLALMKFLRAITKIFWIHSHLCTLYASMCLFPTSFYIIVNTAFRCILCCSRDAFEVLCLSNSKPSTDLPYVISGLTRLMSVKKSKNLSILLLGKSTLYK